MPQMTWRTDDDLLDRVRAAAARHGRSMNEYVTAVLHAATNPDLVDDESQRLRERLARAGLLAPPGARRKRPPAEAVRRARAGASGGVPLSDLVEQGR